MATYSLIPDLYGVVGSDGSITDLVAEGSQGPLGLVRSQVDPVTGRVRNQAGDMSWLIRGGQLPVAFCGDSITDFGYLTSAPPLVSHDIRGYASHMMAQSVGRVVIGAVLGKPGYTSAQILPLMDAWLAGLTEPVVFWFAGANDHFGATISAQTLFSRIMNGVQKIRAAGKVAITATILPRGDAMSAAEVQLRDETNKLLRAERDKGSLLLVDWAHIFQASDGSFPANITYDQVHPYFGAERMGKLLLDVLEDFLPRAVSPEIWARVGRTGWISNGVLAGTAGTAGTGCTGQVATGWTAQAFGTGAAAVCSKVASTDDDPTDWQQAVVTAGAATAFFSIQQQIAAQAGTARFCAVVDVDCPVSALTGVAIKLQSYSGSSPIFDHLNAIDQTKFFPAGSRRLFLCTPVANLSLADATSAFLSVGCSVASGKTVTLKIRRIGWI